MTRKVQVGSVAVGGGAPISVQSMTNTDTRDVEATLSQIRALSAAGADIVRVSVYDMECARAVRELVDGSPVPLVADIHFDHKLAIAAAENGIHKLRINPVSYTHLDVYKRQGPWMRPGRTGLFRGYRAHAELPFARAVCRSNGG